MQEEISVTSVANLSMPSSLNHPDAKPAPTPLLSNHLSIYF